ncbi:MAG: hypothetical protein HY789_03100 [Deltaproteobacteria bacterium]|nr:hypothetical protein [Deltaproteobacteria bacterium]
MAKNNYSFEKRQKELAKKKKKEEKQQRKQDKKSPQSEGDADQVQDEGQIGNNPAD